MPAPRILATAGVAIAVVGPIWGVAAGSCHIARSSGGRLDSRAPESDQTFGSPSRCECGGAV